VDAPGASGRGDDVVGLVCKLEVVGSIPSSSTSVDSEEAPERSGGFFAVVDGLRGIHVANNAGSSAKETAAQAADQMTKPPRG
jgi:hypothetical protein